MSLLSGVFSASNVKVYGLSAVAAALFTYGAAADAAWTRTHAFDCTTFGGSPADAGYALRNNSTTGEMYVLCAVTDTSWYAKQNISRVNIHGYDGNSSLRAGALACYATYYAAGGACGAQVQSAVGTGQMTLSPPTTVWTSSTAAHFGYLWIRVPRWAASGVSYVRGYFTTT